MSGKSDSVIRAEVEAKLHEYFERYEKSDYDGIIENVYAIPVKTGFGNVVGLRMTAEDAKNSLTQLKKQAREAGWIASPITSIYTHILSDGLVFADLSYQRQKAGDNPETQNLSVVYVLQNLENGWRVTSFYGRDQDKPLITS